MGRVDSISSDVEEYLARGGTIDFIKNGVSAFGADGLPKSDLKRRGKQARYDKYAKKFLGIIREYKEIKRVDLREITASSYAVVNDVAGQLEQRGFIKIERKRSENCAMTVYYSIAE